jgi:hypothetical protein
MKFVDLAKVTVTGLLVCTLSAYGQNGSNNVEQWVESILSIRRRTNENISEHA